jgi:hypothetical protein
MKILILFFLIPFFSFGQFDTIYSSSGKIAASIKEIGESSIKYTYPNEDMLNNMNKNVIRKIVFKSGRVQTFSNITSYRTLKSGKDYENVTITQVSDEVKGLYKIGEASSKAKGTTALASIEKVKERAVRKLKIQAAMEGANIVYATQFQTTDNIPGESGAVNKEPQPTMTTISGVAYSSEIPNYDEFKQVLGVRRLFTAIEFLDFKTSFNLLDPFGGNTDIDFKTINRTVEISSIEEESGLIMVQAKIDKESNQKFRVIYFNKEEFTLAFKTDKGINNYRIKISN